MILAKEYIKTAFSKEDAEKLDKAILREIANDEIIVDFTEISYFTTLFFNNALAKYIVEFTPNVYDNKFKIINLSEVGQNTYTHSYNNAVEYYELPPEKRKIQDYILKDVE